MPTYEYACTACGEHLEVVQSFKDEPLTVCPNCDGPLRKVFAPIGVVFKGSGFYKTDSRSSQKSAKTASGDKSSGDGASADSGSSAGDGAAGSKGSAAAGGDKGAASSTKSGAKESTNSSPGSSSSSGSGAAAAS
jgi:putative FmdB family regulatory protein